MERKWKTETYDYRWHATGDYSSRSGHQQDTEIF